MGRNRILRRQAATLQHTFAGLGVQMDNSTTVSGYRQNSNAGSVASTHAYGAGKAILGRLLRISHTFEQAQTASFAILRRHTRRRSGNITGIASAALR